MHRTAAGLCRQPHGIFPRELEAGHAGRVFRLAPRRVYGIDCEVRHDGKVALGTRLLDAFPSYAWQIVVLPFFVVAGVFLAVFLWRELRRRRARVLVALALTCFVVAVGLDFFEGLDADHPWNIYTRITEAVDFGDSTEYRFRRTAYDTLGHFSKSIEEFLEMLGNTLLWVVFLQHLSGLARDLRIRFVDEG